MPTLSRGVLLGEIDHREPADAPCATRFDVVEVDTARDYLIVPVTQTPILAATE